MAQPPPHFMQGPNQQPLQRPMQVPQQQPVGAMSMNQTQVVGKAQPKTPVDDLRSSFQTLVLPLLTASDLVNTPVAQEELKHSIEFSFQNFLKSAKVLEADFVKKRATLAKQHPELVTQETNEEIKYEIRRIDELIRQHSAKCKEWKVALDRIQHIKEPAVPASFSTTPGQPMMNIQPDMQVKQQPMG